MDKVQDQPKRGIKHEKEFSLANSHSNDSYSLAQFSANHVFILTQSPIYFDTLTVHEFSQLIVIFCHNFHIYFLLLTPFCFGANRNLKNNFCLKLTTCFFYTYISITNDTDVHIMLAYLSRQNRINK